MGKSGRHFMISFMATVTGVYLVFALTLFLFQRSLLYHPDSSAPEFEASGIGTMEVVTLKTSDGLRLLSWYRRAAPGRPTLVYFHGNAGNIESRGFKVRDYLEQGFGVLLVGYRGYGGNPGKPSEEGLYLDGRAALEFLAADGVAADRWVLYGESLGTGIAVQLAAEWALEAPVGAVVLESPFTSLGDAAAFHYPFIPARFLVRDRFQSIDKIAGIRAPVFIVSGENDGIIPAAHGKKLFRAAKDPKEGHWVAGGGHNNLYDFGVPKMVINFIRRNLPSPG